MHDKPHTKETKLKCSEAQKKRWASGAYKDRATHTEETRKKIRNTLRKGLHKNCIVCEKEFYTPKSVDQKCCSRDCSKKLFIGENNPNWVHGNSRSIKTGYYSFEYKNWRKAVFEKDDYTCQMCLQRGGKLQAHHIKPFAKHDKLRFALLNGMTLCVECHRKIHRLHKRVIGG